MDSDGHYSVLMGATHNDGMPLDLFTSGEPRWLGVQFNRPGEGEQPRVLLVSVPYALKAADAETLGGKPASAYLLAAPTVGSDTARESTSTTTVSVKPKATPANYLRFFADPFYWVGPSSSRKTSVCRRATTARRASNTLGSSTVPESSDMRSAVSSGDSFSW